LFLRIKPFIGEDQGVGKAGLIASVQVLESVAISAPVALLLGASASVFELMGLIVYRKAIDKWASENS